MEAVKFRPLPGRLFDRGVARPQPRADDEATASARGIALGVALGSLMWFGLAASIWSL